MDVDRFRQPQQLEMAKKPNWNTCSYCNGMKFKQLNDFTFHLRTEHCTVEGGSFVCRYGYNSVCYSLPVEGVSDLDYAEHIIKHHAFSSDSSQPFRKHSTSSEKSVISVATGPSGWLVVSASQNLAAVLNDPTRGKQKDFFTKVWGADFVETPFATIPPNPHLPLVTRAHFETYLRKISKRHRRHHQLRSQLSDLQQFPAQRRRQRSLERRTEPLDVPAIFLQANFELSQPTVFYTALPFARAGITVNGTFRPNGKILQEKLTQCMDQVEMRIAEQVAEKSEAFFAAMTSHDTLMDQLGKTLTVVRNLRARLRTVDERVACQAFRALQLQQRRINHLLVLQKLKLMRTVHQTQPQIQILLSAPDYVAALELIVTSQEILERELSTVHCFRHLGPQLSEITGLIDKMMTSEFVSYSTRDLNRPLIDDFEVLEKEKLVCIMLGMLRRGSTSFIGQYQDEAYTAIRALVKQIALERLAESDCEGHGSFVDRVQSLPLPHYLPLMDIVTFQLAKLLRKIKGVHDVMKDTLDMAAGVKTTGTTVDNDSFSFLTSKESTKANTELQKMLKAVCGFAHEECAKLLNNVIALDTANVVQVGQLCKVVTRFSQDCVDVSGRGSEALRAAFQSAANRFLSQFHLKRKDRLIAKLDSETWKPSDVAKPIQVFVTAVANEGTLLDLVDYGSFQTERFIMVDNEKYIVVGSVVDVITCISEYASIARQLPLIASRLLRDLVELLNYFNSRSCQLVLGAGALQTAKLSKITATNLVLTSRALQLLIWFLPHIRNHFEGLSENLQKNGKSSWVNSVDDAEKNMSKHIGELHEKVVFIVSDVIANELLSWAAKPPVPSSAFSKVSGHLVKLHEAVSGVLPENQVEDLYRKINDKFKSALREQLKKLNIVNDGGPQHGTVAGELIFYATKLKDQNVLPSEDLSDKSFIDIWLPK